jgi:hypothetical protein
MEQFGELVQVKIPGKQVVPKKETVFLRMSEDNSMTENLNVFNTIISQLYFVDIKITKEEKCVILLCSLPNSWDILVLDIEINSTTLALEYMVSSLLSEEMRRKNMEGSTNDELVVRGRPIDIDKGIFSGRNSKSKGRSKSSTQSMRRCWKCGKARNYKRDYNSKETVASTRPNEK